MFLKFKSGDFLIYDLDLRLGKVKTIFGLSATARTGGAPDCPLVVPLNLVINYQKTNSGLSAAARG